MGQSLFITKPQRLDEYPKVKLFAVLTEDHTVIDGVLYDSLATAQKAHPDRIIVQMFLENSPLEVGQKMKEVDKWLDLQSSLME